MLSKKEQIRVGEWLASGRYGMSSLTMLSVALGYLPSFMHTPSDPSDFKRCIVFLDSCIDNKTELLEQLGRLSKKWNNLKWHWKELTDLYYEEAPSGKLPKLYDNIQKLTK